MSNIQNIFKSFPYASHVDVDEFDKITVFEHDTVICEITGLELPRCLGKYVNLKTQPTFQLKKHIKKHGPWFQIKGVRFMVTKYDDTLVNDKYPIVDFVRDYCVEDNDE